MNITITLDDPVEVRIDEIHPVNLQDAPTIAVEATVELAQRLQATSDT